MGISLFDMQAMQQSRSTEQTHAMVDLAAVLGEVDAGWAQD